ncbi:thioesterase domain-containing protein [Kitasatospora sp. NPDC002965]|uniref:thioesterase domain-containing protein n=1 Tax=Kitasatospora sp. NPDC002965 TaxID=3154775 RepID=UPI0033B8C36A
MQPNFRTRIPPPPPADGRRAGRADTADPLGCRAVERLLCELWSAHFGHRVSPYDDFFDLGGDSLAITTIVAAARERGLRVRSSAALRHPTPARLAEHLTLGGPGAGGTPTGPPRALALDPGAAAAVSAPDWTAADVRPEPIAEGDPAAPLFVVHSDRHVRAERAAVARWTGGRAAHGYALPGARGPIPPFGSVGEVAERLLADLRGRRPDGPYRLAGFGLGAVVALELARRLRGSGAQVALLALVAPPAGPAPGEPDAGPDDLLGRRLALLAGRFGLTGGESLAEIHDRIAEEEWYDGTVGPGDLPRLQLAWARLASAVRAHAYEPYDGRALLFLDGPDPHPAERAWAGAARPPDVHRLDHGLESPLAVIHDPQVAETMRKALDV